LERSSEGARWPFGQSCAANPRPSEAQTALTVFIDTSVWFAAANVRDRQHARAKSILKSVGDPLLTDHVLVETWWILNSRIHRKAADEFWAGIRRGAAELALITPADLEAAWAIGETFADQNFSIVDRTSFAVMERLAVDEAASFDDDFAVYRYGRARNRAFRVIR